MESSLPHRGSRCHTRIHCQDPWNEMYQFLNFIHLYLNCCQTETTSSMILCCVGPFEPTIVWLGAALTWKLWVDEMYEKKWKKMCQKIINFHFVWKLNNTKMCTETTDKIKCDALIMYYEYWLRYFWNSGQINTPVYEVNRAGYIVIV